MGIMDIFHVTTIKKENERLLTELEDTKKLLTPEMMDACNLENHIRELQSKENEINERINNANIVLNEINSKIDTRQELLVDVEEQLLYQDFALYKPKYEMVNSEAYKERLNKIRETQKALIKNGHAVSGNMNWTLNGSKSEGQKMVKNMQKLLLRAFNSECDEVIRNVTYANIDLYEKRLYTSYEITSKLGRIMHIII